MAVENFSPKIVYHPEFSSPESRQKAREARGGEEPLAGTRLKLTRASELGRLFRTAFEAWPSREATDRWTGVDEGLIGVL